MKNVKNSTIACRDAHESAQLQEAGTLLQAERDAVMSCRDAHESVLLRMDLRLQGSWCSYALHDCA